MHLFDLLIAQGTIEILKNLSTLLLFKIPAYAYELQISSMKRSWNLKVLNRLLRITGFVHEMFLGFKSFKQVPRKNRFRP